MNDTEIIISFLNKFWYEMWPIKRNCLLKDRTFLYWLYVGPLLFLSIYFLKHVGLILSLSARSGYKNLAVVFVSFVFYICLLVGLCYYVYDTDSNYIFRVITPLQWESRTTNILLYCSRISSPTPISPRK